MCLLLLGLTLCVSGDKELRVKLLKLKLENLVRSGGEGAADQALETFSQVMWLTSTLLMYPACCMYDTLNVIIAAVKTVIFIIICVGEAVLRL